MNKLLTLLVAGLIIPVLVCQADVLPLNKASEPSLSPPVVHSIDLPKIVVTKKFKDHNFAADTMVKETYFPTNRKYAAFLSQVSPEYSVSKNFLKLTKVPYTRRKQSFMFVFLMNNREKTPNAIESKRTQMHVMWPGSKKVPIEQKIVKDEYPVDFSLANYDEGYAAGEWNVVLPNKKPREVAVSFLWSF